jgi:hypothetical protein
MLNLKTMISLPLSLRKNGFNYTQVCRGERSCIYAQRVRQKQIAHEVFIVQTRSERYILGKIILAKEKFPSNEDFGKTAWTTWTLEQAKMKFNGLEHK